MHGGRGEEAYRAGTDAAGTLPFAADRFGALAAPAGGVAAGGGEVS